MFVFLAKSWHSSKYYTYQENVLNVCHSFVRGKSGLSLMEAVWTKTTICVLIAEQNSSSLLLLAFKVKKRVGQENSLPPLTIPNTRK